MTDIAEELAEKYPTVDSLERAPLDWIWNRYDQKRERLGESQDTAAKYPSPHGNKAPRAQVLRCLTHEAGISPRHAEGDGLTGLTSDGGLGGMTSDGDPYHCISVPASFAGRTPVTRARIPWSMPEASV